MTAPKHISDFPADTKWIQLDKGAIAVLPDGRVYRMEGNNVEELQAKETEGKAGAAAIDDVLRSMMENMP